MTGIVPRWILNGLDLTQPPFAVEWGADHGSPESETEALPMRLQDGEIVSLLRSSNRTIPLNVLIEAGDYATLAKYEDELFAAANPASGRGELEFHPGDSVGEPVIFDVFPFVPAYQREEGMELAGMRRYPLAIPALPWPRAKSPVHVPSLPVPPAVVTEVLVDDCSATTGWTASGGTLTVSDGMVGVVEADGAFLDLIRTAAIPDLTYLKIVGTRGSSVTGTSNLSFWLDGVTVYPVSQSGAWAYDPIPAGTPWEAWLPIPAGGASSLRIRQAGSATNSLFVDQILATDASPWPGTGRQQARTIDIYGSRPTEMSLLIEGRDADDLPVPLGDDVLVYTATEDTFVPPIREYWTGGATADPAAVSGAFTLFSDDSHFEIPVGLLKPSTYTVWARCKTSSPGTKNFQLLAESSALGFSVASETRDLSVSIPFADYAITIPIARLDLPVTESTGPDDLLKLSFVGGPADSSWDDVYLFDVNSGQLTAMDPTPGPGVGEWSRLRLAAATVDRPKPSVWYGHAGSDAEVRSDSRATSFGQHLAKPGRLMVFVATQNCPNAEVSADYSPRFGHHAHAIPNPES